jgi:hypothetical protein
MKVKTTYTEENDYGEGESFNLTMFIGELSYGFTAGGGEPEDNRISRDLNFVRRIPNMLKEAYEAGKRGEKFELKEETLKL